MVEEQGETFMIRHFIAAAAFALLGACASQGEQTASAPADRDCFRADDIFGYGIVDDHSVDVRVGTRHYIFTTTWNARDLDWSQQLAIRSTTNWICTGNALGVEIIGGQPPRTYPIQSIARAPEAPEAVGS